MTTEITINFIWVESGYEWEIPEDWDDPSSNVQSVSENLNEIAYDWDDTNLLSLEFIVKNLVSPPDFLTNPDFDTVPLSQILKASSNSHQTIEMLPKEWINLGNSLLLKDVNPSVIAVPQGMTPWEWYSLTEAEKLNQMGLSFDIYKFGFFSYELSEGFELESILSDSRFNSYSKEIMNRGPDSEFHTTCDDKCAFRACSKMFLFPASISRW